MSMKLTSNVDRNFGGTFSPFLMIVCFGIQFENHCYTISEKRTGRKCVLKSEIETNFHTLNTFLIEFEFEELNKLLIHRMSSISKLEINHFPKKVPSLFFLTKDWEMKKKSFQFTFRGFDCLFLRYHSLNRSSRGQKEKKRVNPER